MTWVRGPEEVEIGTLVVNALSEDPVRLCVINRSFFATPAPEMALKLLVRWLVPFP